MTAVLVHEVPEASALWGPLADHLSNDDIGHWWMLDDPKGSAGAINEFWAGLS